MRLGAFVLATLVAGSVSPLGDTVRDEVRDIRATQYERGRQAACNIRVLNALTSQDEAQIRRVEQRCARFFADVPAERVVPAG